MIKRALYFAYGSNLNVAQMKQRCPEAQAIGPAVLPGHELIFRGVADVTRAQGEETPGAVWRITDKCLQALDRYEGYPHLYDRKWATVTMEDGTEYKALVYFMKQGKPAPPSLHYYDVIATGYEDFNLNKSTLDRAATANRGRMTQALLF